MSEFEKDLKNKIDSKEVPMYFTQSGGSIIKEYIETNWLLDTYKDWRSDEHVQKLLELGGSYVLANQNLVHENRKLIQEIVDLKSELEHQERVNESIEVKEKEIKRLRKINHLYKKAKGNAERMAVDRGERLNQAQDEIAYLKSQLQQQALQVVPECVAEWYEKNEDNLEVAIYRFCVDLYKKSFSEMAEPELYLWFYDSSNKGIETLIRMKDGYKIKEEQKFYLKNKLTDMYLYKKPLCGYGEEPTESIECLTDDFKFTQKEIDGMDVQGYDKEDEYKEK